MIRARARGTTSSGSAVAVAVLLVLSARSAGAQGFTTGDSVLRRLWSLGMDSSQVARYAQTITDSIGPRLTGSPAQRAGIAWLLATYKALGIEARTEQYGTWTGWRRGTSHIDLVAPRVRSLEGMMLAWSPGTGNRDVQGATVIIPDVADSTAFKAWLPRVKGKFVLVSPPQPTCRPDDDWQAFALPATFARMKAERLAAAEAWTARLSNAGVTTRTLPVALDKAGAAGIITSVWSAGWGVTKIFRARTERAVTFDLSCEDYGLVYRLTQHDQGAMLRARADAERTADVPVFNVIAEIKGADTPDEYVMLSAHFDSWDGSSGATDNATGTVTMLEAMRLLKTAYPHPKRTILVGHWSGEEQGLNGSRAFAADHPGIVQGLQALFNQDNGTGRIVTLSGMGLTTASGFIATWTAQLPDELSRNIDFSFPGLPSTGGSDYLAFLCSDAPGFNLGSLGWNYGTYTWHTNRDTYDKIVLDDLRSNAVLTAMLVYLAAEDPERVPRTRRVMPLNAQTGQPIAWPTCATPARSAAEGDR